MADKEVRIMVFGKIKSRDKGRVLVVDGREGVDEHQVKAELGEGWTLLHFEVQRNISEVIIKM